MPGLTSSSKVAVRLQTLLDHAKTVDHRAKLDWPVFSLVVFADDEHTTATLIGANRLIRDQYPALRRSVLQFELRKRTGRQLSIGVARIRTISVPRSAVFENKSTRPIRANNHLSHRNARWLFGSGEVRHTSTGQVTDVTMHIPMSTFLTFWQKSSDRKAHPRMSALGCYE